MTRNGDRYLYKNVSRRAMANLKLNQNMSFGFWANQNLVNSDRTSFEYLDCKAWTENEEPPTYSIEEDGEIVWESWR